MGRMMPFECPHGAILDWGDFGGEPPNEADPEPCSKCDSEEAAAQEAGFQRAVDAVLGFDAFSPDITPEAMARQIVFAVMAALEPVIDLHE